MTKQETCRISLAEKSCSLFDSKIGGLPYCSKDVQLPTNSEGRQLILLAQINFSQVPEMNKFPRKGILQFFISNDDLYGMNFDDWSEQKDFRIIFYENIDFNISDNDVISKLNVDKTTDLPLPFNNKTLKMSFNLKYEGISYGDYHFENLFLQTYNKKFKNKPLNNFFEIDDDIFEKILDRNYDIFSGTKIGGYPYFMQTDPRTNEEYQKYDTLLFQCDSDDNICWGDAGVANFFIKTEDLLKFNFNNVGYSWDCL